MYSLCKLGINDKMSLREWKTRTFPLCGTKYHFIYNKKNTMPILHRTATLSNKELQIYFKTPDSCIVLTSWAVATPKVERIKCVTLQLRTVRTSALFQKNWAPCVRRASKWDWDLYYRWGGQATPTRRSPSSAHHGHRVTPRTAGHPTGTGH